MTVGACDIRAYLIKYTFYLTEVLKNLQNQRLFKQYFGLRFQKIEKNVSNGYSNNVILIFELIKKSHC